MSECSWSLWVLCHWCLIYVSGVSIKVRADREREKKRERKITFRYLYRVFLEYTPFLLVHVLCIKSATVCPSIFRFPTLKSIHLKKRRTSTLVAILLHASLRHFWTCCYSALWVMWFLFCANRCSVLDVIGRGYLALHSAMNLQHVFYSGICFLIAEFPAEKRFVALISNLGNKRDIFFRGSAMRKTKGSQNPWNGKRCRV